ncbi:MAG: sigma-54 dependent transcriptional regulator [Bacteroidota bacterium]
MNATVLIIDDEKKLSGLLARILELEGYRVLQAATARDGLKTLTREDVLLVICDVKLPDGNGVDLIKLIKEQKPYVEVISLTAYGTIADGVKAIQNGAFNYITKGDDNDKIIPLLALASNKAQAQYNLFRQHKKAAEKIGFAQIIGQSPLITAAVKLARRVAATDTTVLLLGETGVGKEVFASAIHYESERRLMPFVAVNCSSFTGQLLESELFGYKAGAFTGANKDKKGLFEEAQHGTVFLDEIGEMNPELQSRLLRVLESKTFIKLGDTQTTKVNVRIIAATNRDLEKDAETGRFRADLFYRLSVFTISLPALNERREDIKELAEYYAQEFSIKAHGGNGQIKMSPLFLQSLERHNWKGNVRELKNVMERAVILADTDMLTPDLLPAELNHNQLPTDSLALAEVERRHIQKVLAYTKGNKTESARLLGIGLTTLYRKLEEYIPGQA